MLKAMLNIFVPWIIIFLGFIFLIKRGHADIVLYVISFFVCAREIAEELDDYSDNLKKRIDKLDEENNKRIS